MVALQALLEGEHEPLDQLAGTVESHGMQVHGWVDGAGTGVGAGAGVGGVGVMSLHISWHLDSLIQASWSVEIMHLPLPVAKEHFHRSTLGVGAGGVGVGAAGAGVGSLTGRISIQSPGWMSLPAAS